MYAKLARSCLLLALLALTCSSVVRSSIEREPVKVDKNNAGPKYDFDDLERTRVLVENNNNNNQESNQVLTAPQRDSNDNSNQEAPMLSIRRIFLVPVMSSPSDENNERPIDAMRMFGMPQRSLFNPFGSRHLFGADEASKPAPVNPDESQERPVLSPPSFSSEQEPNERPGQISGMFDPVEMLMEAMRQALNPANMMPPQPQTPEATDLNKEASGEGNKSAGGETGLASLDKKPQSFNSTKEDIVEIEGKKYLRKTVVNRHVGDGIMFMTRRLIFSPLNETETETTTPSNKDATSTTTTTTTSEPATEQPSKVDKIDEEASVSSTSTTTTTTGSPVASEPATTKEPVATETPSPPQDPSSTTVATDKEDTTKSLGEKITETVSKVERLMEKIVERKEDSGLATADKPSS